MAPQSKTIVGDEDLKRAILEALQKSEKPLHLKAIARNLPKMYKVPDTRLQESLADLNHRSAIHSWGKTRGSETFWAETPEAKVTRALRNALTEPVSSAKLLAKAAKQVPSLPKTARDKLLKQSLFDLLRNGEAIKLPKTSERIGPAAKLPFEEEFARLLQQHPDITRERVEQALASALVSLQPAEEDDLVSRIKDTILAVEPEAKAGALAGLPEVRRRLVPAAAKDAFDQAVLNMVRNGTLSVHEFMGHLQISHEEREQLVSDGQEYYGGVTFRR